MISTLVNKLLFQRQKVVLMVSYVTLRLNTSYLWLNLKPAASVECFLFQTHNHLFLSQDI